jgi:hypothetical protein
MDECRTLTDELAEEMAYRDSATALLDEIAARARTALRGAGITLDIFFIVPPSGDAILTCGAAISKEDWQGIRTVVSRLVQRSIGLDPIQCRQVICAMSDKDDAMP